MPESSYYKILVIIPTFNEAENIGKVIKQVLEAGKNAEVLVVDDSSPDGTSEIVNGISKADERVPLVREKKSGLGTAYVEGFRFAMHNGFGYVMEMDADLSHEPSAIPKFQQALSNHADVVVGSRYASGVSVINWPMKRLLLSYGAKYLCACCDWRSS